MEKDQIKQVIAKRVAMELKDGDVVNLGIGIPTLVPNYLKKGVEVILQTEMVCWVWDRRLKKVKKIRN